MYELARGPLIWVAVIIFILGVFYRTIQLLLLTRKKERAFCPSRSIRENSPEERKYRTLISFQNSLIGKHPIMAIVSFIFHSCLFIAPLFAIGHSLVLYESWGVSFLSLPDGLIDILTILLLSCAVFFLVRRTVFPGCRPFLLPMIIYCFLSLPPPFSPASLPTTSGSTIRQLLPSTSWPEKRC